MHAHQQFQSADPADEDEHHGGGVIAPGHKNVDLTTSSIRDNQWINFLLTHNCSSTTYYASNAVLTAVLDSNLEHMGLIGSIHTTGANYYTATRKVAFTFRAPLPAGSSGEVFIQTKFSSASPGNTQAKNVADFRARNSETAQSNEVAVTGINQIRLMEPIKRSSP